MRLVGGIAALTLALLLPQAALATGWNDAPLSTCVDESRDHLELRWDGGHYRKLWHHLGYRGGVRVFARDRWRGADRVMCGDTRYEIDVRPDTSAPWPSAYVRLTSDYRQGGTGDLNLNKRAKDNTSYDPTIRTLPPYEDIWNGMGRNARGIESFKVVVAAGCKLRVTFYGGLDHEKMRTWAFKNVDGARPLYEKAEIPTKYWGTKEIVWKWKTVWDGDGYIRKKVPVRIKGWVPFDNNITHVTVGTECFRDTGDLDDYEVIDAANLVPGLK